MPACKATKEERVSAVVFGGREGEVKGLVESPVQEVLARISAEWWGRTPGILYYKVLPGRFDHWQSWWRVPELPDWDISPEAM